MAKKKTKEQFIEQAKIVHGDKYDYSKVEYINDATKICIICPIHGEFWQTPNNHLHGKKCPICSHRSFKYTTKEFIEQAKKVHGDKYDYSKVEYINNSTKICIICPIHGEFWQTPLSHFKSGCKKCAQKIIGDYTRKTTKEFIEKAKEVHGDKYDYSKVEYINAKTKVCIICPIHGEFWQTPHKHLNGKHGCLLCKSSKLENEVKLLLENNNIEYIQQKRFDWLGKQSLDFYLPQYNVAIECQGKQHFEPIEYFGGKKEFEIVLKRDKRKYLLCNDNGIKILYYSNIKNYCEINTPQKLIEYILKK